MGLTKTYNLFHNQEVRSEPLANGEWGLEKIKEIREFKNANLQIPIEEAVKRIEKMRVLHKRMDEAVLKAYGWSENGELRMENGEKPIANHQSPIALQHDFYEVDYLPENDRVRYTISPEARKEVLKRLLELNHKIYEEEIKEGLHKEKDVIKFYEQKGEEVPQNAVFSDKKKGKSKKAKGKRDTETKDMFGV